MPNHLHLVLVIDNNDNNGRQIAAPTVQMIIGHLKRNVSLQCGYSVWQKSFHDHIIRNEKEYKQIVGYIESNPEKWCEDCFYVSSPFDV
jgi:REP element-mobilizing transposase RayT